MKCITEKPILVKSTIEETITCSATTFMSEQERKRRHKQRLAVRKAARKVAKNGCVQNNRQMYRDLKIMAAGGVFSTIKSCRNAADNLNAKLNELSIAIRTNISNAYTNLLVSCLHVPNTKSKIWFVGVELVRFIANVIPDSVSATKNALLDLIKHLMGARPEVRFAWQQEEPIVLSAGEVESPDRAARQLADLVGNTLTSRKVNFDAVKTLSLTFNALCVSSKHIYSFVNLFFSKYYYSITRKITAYFGLTETKTDVFVNDRPGAVKLQSLSDYVLEADSVINAQMEVYADVNYRLRAQDLMEATTLLKQAIMRDVIRADHHQKMLVQKTIEDVARWRNTNYHHLRLQANKTVEPFHLCFAGPPKQGKSVLTKFFANCAVEAPSLSWIFLNQNIYSKGHTKYWDRYRGQEVVIRDDMCAVNSSNDLDMDDRKFLMDIMTCTDFQIPMADLTDKGMLSATKLLVSSTNKTYMQKGSAFANEEALNRRRNLLYYVVLDMSCPHKAVAQNLGLHEDFGNYRFVKLNPLKDDLNIAGANFVESVKDGTVPSVDIGTVCGVFTREMNTHFNSTQLASLTSIRKDVMAKVFTSDNEPSPTIVNACDECVEGNEDSSHVWYNEEFYDVVVNWRDGAANESSAYFQNVPRDLYVPLYTNCPAHCFACGCVRYVHVGEDGTAKLTVVEVQNRFVEPWRNPEGCDCFITEKEHAYGDETEFECIRLPMYDSRGSVWQVNAQRHEWINDDDDEIRNASQDEPEIGIQETFVEHIKRVFIDGLGWTEEMLENLGKRIPVWAWAIIASFGVAASIAAVVKLFKSNEQETEVAMEMVPMSSDDLALFKATMIDKKEAKTVLEYVIQKARALGWNHEKTIAEYYNASKGYDENVRTSARRLPPTLPRTYVTNVVAACLTEIGFDQVKPQIMKNARHIKIETNGVKRGQMCLFTHGRQFVVNTHTWRICKPESKVTISYANGAGDVGEYELKGSDFETVSVENEDLSYVLCKSKAVPAAKDIRSHFGSVEDVMSNSIYTHVLWDKEFNCTLSTNVGDVRGGTVTDPDGNRVYVPKMIYVGVLGKIGDCGTVIVKNDKIVGLMNGTALNTAMCTFVPLTRDMPDLETSVLVDDREEIVASVVVNACVGNVFPRGTTEHVGQACADYANKISDRTKILPTDLNGPAFKPEFKLYELTKFPPVMTIKDKRIDQEVVDKGDGPMQIGVDKFKKPMVPPLGTPLRRATLAVSTMLSMMTIGFLGKRLLTMDEIINGVVVDGTRVVEGLNMATSMGLPFRNLVQRLRRTARGKLDYFVEIGSQGDCKKFAVEPGPLGQELMRDYERIKNDLANGKVPFWVVAENLKDEPLKMSKIKAAKTRIFETLPCSATMVFREYFGAWTEAVRANCVEFPISVGIAAQKRDWTTAALRLLRHGNRIIAGDYVNWDGKTPADVMFAACDVINAWYNDEYAKERELLIYALVHQYMVAGRNVMFRHGGMSSGSPITSELNSLVNWLLLLCCFQEIAAEQGVVMTSDDLKSQFEFMLYGDDHVVSVGEKFEGIVTFAKVRDWMVGHGIGYTDSGKTDNVFDYETLEEITFLKRKFVNDNGRYRAPLDINSIRMSVMWWHKRRGTDSLKILEDKKNSFESEMFMHGEQVYDREVSLFNSSLTSLKDGLRCDVSCMPLIMNTYEEHYSTWIAET